MYIHHLFWNLWDEENIHWNAFETTGSCVVSNSCVSSPGYPIGHIDDYEECSIKILEHVNVNVAREFNLGSTTLIIDEENVYEASNIPLILADGVEIFWDNGIDVTYECTAHRTFC